MSTMYRLALVLLLLGAATPTPAAVVVISLKNFRFEPNDVTIQPGDTVQWMNEMGLHNVRADDGSFSRPVENAPWTFEKTFTQAGEVVFYHCSEHSSPGQDINSSMNGRINVGNVAMPMPTPTPTPRPVAEVEVKLRNFRFIPNEVTIQAGTTVRWVNQEGFHDVLADDGSFGRLRALEGWTFERTFTQAGEVVFYHCSEHSFPGLDISSMNGPPMNGRINVVNDVPTADIIVNTVSDELNADGDCSLREAITSANSNLLTDACAIGGAGDSIGFSVGGTVALNSPLPAITSEVDIIGPVGDPISISGGGAAQLFVVGNGGILRLDALTLSGGLASDGGAIINNIGGTLSVSNSTFSGNRAQQSGGAIRNLGVATIVNSTFASNSAAVSGGALADSGVGANMTLINCTIAANSAALQGGGIATEQQGAVTLRNTLFGNNAGGNCLALDSGTISDGGGNLDDGTSCGLVASASLSNAGAGLDPADLRDNGGPTQTIALVAGSQAIDRGIEAVCADATTVNGRDQRGEPRPRDGNADGGFRCDIGAFELIPPTCRGLLANISVSNNTIVGGPDSGTPYTGTLRGTNGDDVIVGTDANDSINGAQGNDTICGGAGRDTLRGAQGSDRLFGEFGRDRLLGGTGRDLCNGGRDQDIDTVSSCERLQSIP